MLSISSIIWGTTWAKNHTLDEELSPVLENPQSKSVCIFTLILT